MGELIEIDGALGEGGGQIIRTALSLSVLTGKSFAMKNIRANRPNPGLQEQHLTCIRACREICAARVEGDAIKSAAFSFSPSQSSPGSYHFSIKTAGAISLVLQCIYYPLAFLQAPSQVTLAGGTHVYWSPSFEFLAWNWLPLIRKPGYRGEISLEKAGYFPRGGGTVKAKVLPARKLDRIRMLFRGALKGIQVFIGSSGLPDSVRERMRKIVRSRLKEHLAITRISDESVPSAGINAYLCITAYFEHSQACFTDVGRKGRPAEDVARQALDDFDEYQSRRGALDLHMADQILLPLALIGEGASVYTTTHVTGHLLTNADILRRFLPVDIEIQGTEGEEGRVSVKV